MEREELRIEKIQNGYIVYTFEDNKKNCQGQGITFNPPYVFESINNLTEFIKERLSF